MRYGANVRSIMVANGLSDALIYSGQRLRIPASQSARTTSTATPTQVGCREGDIVVVQAGDTLSSIAARYGASVEALKQANGLLDDTILVGQALRISCQTATATPARPMQTSTATATRTGQCNGYYVVQAGDTLAAVAARCGVSLSALKSANGLVNSRVLVGQRLRLPVSGSRPAPASTPPARTASWSPASFYGPNGYMPFFVVGR